MSDASRPNTSRRTAEGLEPAALAELTRKRDRGGDRALLDEVLDTQLVGTVSTVADGWPWSLPMLFARDGERILLHGSSGAGLLRHVGAGEAAEIPITLSVFVLDGLVVADTLFDHSANYRSAVVRGRVHVSTDPIGDLTILSDRLIPGRSAETPAVTGKESAATLTLVLPIIEGQWIAKARRGGPGVDTNEWTGVIPVGTQYGTPQTATGDLPPPSVQRLVDGE